jgi:glycosyltransferase involved in cell wall biosynthesis
VRRVVNLSFCIIVKNEAVNLPRCLESVRSIADELIVLDTGSTDDTVAIAQSFQAQVHSFVWCNDFSAARNAGLHFAQGDWVLVLDADEVLVPAVIPSLKRAMQPADALVINLVRQEIGAVQSPYSLVSRLFRRHPDIQFTRPYHAMIDDSVAQLLRREPHWQVLDLPDVAILHYGYEPGAIASRDKFQTARATMEGFFASHPDDPYVCSKLGALYVEMGEVDRGVKLLHQGLNASSSDGMVQYELHYHLGIAYTRLRNLPLAETHYWQAIEQSILPSLKLGAYNNLGSVLQAQGDWGGAKAAYETVLKIAPDLAIAHYNLGMALKAMGKLAEAIAAYQQAIALNPQSAEAHQNLGVALLKVGRVNESLAAFQRAIALHEPQNPSEATRLRQGLRDMGFTV